MHSLARKLCSLTSFAWVVVPIVMMMGTASCRGGAGASSPAAATAPSALAITHVSLIDPLHGPRPDVTILIDGDRIVDVGPSAAVAIPAGARVLDAAGRFAMPGLWDAHVHVSQITVDAIPLLIANGVTSVRDMGSAYSDIVRWKEMRSAGGVVPRVFSPGPKLQGRGEEGADSWVIASPEDARRAVHRLKMIGVDFIKVHANLPRPIYDAIAAASRAEGLSFAGHAEAGHPPSISIAAGQRTLEHGRGMLPCSNDLRERIRADASGERLMKMCAAESDREPMFAAMVRAGAWHTPTLASWRGATLLPAEIARLPGVAHTPAALEERWGAPEPPSAVAVELLSGVGPLALNAHRAGVALLVGTDAGDPYVVPGFAVHDELQLFVDAGLAPLQAIRSATIEPARALGVADRLGSIERGKVADVILLDADPLRDIRNTRRIAAVIINGRVIERARLAALLAPANSHSLRGIPPHG